MAGLLLARADRARGGESKARPIDLWRLAEKEATGRNDRERIKERRKLFHHAMIHAGFLIEAKTGVPYAICPSCSESLLAA